MSSRSSHTDNGKLARRRVKKSLKITSQVNENTHPRSNTAQHLIDETLADADEHHGGVSSREDDCGQKFIVLSLAVAWQYA